MGDRTISLKLSSKLLQQAEEIAGKDELLHDFLISAIENEVQRRQVFTNKADFWQKVEKLRELMKQEGIEIDPQEIWGDIRDKGIGREIIL
jgi:predicted ArsR family transcriptional regulator